MDYEILEKSKRNYNKNLSQINWWYILLLLFFCGVIFWMMPILNLGLRYVQWEFQEPDSYIFEQSHLGLTKETAYLVNDYESLGYTPPYEQLIVDMFKRSYQCLINPRNRIFCRVQYNSDYGFPESVEYDFIEGGWISIHNFVVVENYQK